MAPFSQRICIKPILIMIYYQASPDRSFSIKHTLNGR